MEDPGVKKLRPEISLFRGGQLLGRSVIKGRSLSTGKDWKCDIPDPHSEYGRLTILKKGFRGYILNLPIGSHGSFRKGGSALSLDQMVRWGLAHKTSSGYAMPLDDDTSAEFTIGDTTFRMAFGEVVPVQTVSPATPYGTVPFRLRFGFPDPSDIVFTAILILVFALEVLSVRGLRDYPIPEIRTLQQLPRRISRLILEPSAPPPVPRVIRPSEKGSAPKGPETGGAVKAGKETPPAEPRESAVLPGPSKVPAPGGGVETTRRHVSGIGVLGVLTGRGTAGRTAGEKGVTALQLNEKMERDLDRVLSEVRGITVPGTGAGGGSETGNREGTGNGLITIDGKIAGEGTGGRIQVSDIGGGTAAPGPAEKTEVIRPETRDERSSRVISRVVASHTGAIRYAYNRELRKNPALRGKIVLAFSISPEGDVIKCTVQESEMKWPPLEESLVRMVLGWKFPKIPEGTVTVSYPLVFFPSM